jgi:hypothetical protein
VSIAKFSAKPNPKASGRNVDYICRQNGCASISFHNLDKLDAKNELEKRSNAIAYAETREIQEQYERGNRNHYRLILSWDRTEETEFARDKTHEFLQKKFANCLAIIAIHQDTEHTHAHIWIDARNLNGKKLQINHREYRSIDEHWAQNYDKNYGTEYAKKYELKKLETTKWKEKRASTEKFIGKQPLPTDKPGRANDNLTADFYREKELIIYRGNNDKRRFREDKRGASTRNLGLATTNKKPTNRHKRHSHQS